MERAGPRARPLPIPRRMSVARALVHGVSYTFRMSSVPITIREADTGDVFELVRLRRRM